MINQTIWAFVLLAVAHAGYSVPYVGWEEFTFVKLANGHPIPLQCYVQGAGDGTWALHPVDGRCLREWAKKHQRKGESVTQAIVRLEEETHRELVSQQSLPKLLGCVKAFWAVDGKTIEQWKGGGRQIGICFADNGDVKWRIGE